MKKCRKVKKRAIQSRKKCHPRKSCCSIWKNCRLFQKRGANFIQGRVPVKYGKGTECFRKVPLPMKKNIQCRKVPSKAEKMSSKEELKFNMDKVLSVSEKMQKSTEKCHSKQKKCHPMKSWCSILKRCRLFQKKKH